MISDPELAWRLAAAGLVGAAIGFEREWRNPTAGIRTHALVAIGAALFTVAGAYGFGDLHRSPTIDPARVAAQVASGIGFIGAGAIIRNGASVRGVTTAATLWTSAAVGVACGAGFVLAALLGAALVLATLLGLRALKSLMRDRAGSQLAVEYERGHGTIGPLLRSLELAGCEVRTMRVEDDGADLEEPGIRRVIVQVSPQAALADVVAELERRPEVHSAHLDGSA